MIDLQKVIELDNFVRSGLATVTSDVFHRVLVNAYKSEFLDDADTAIVQRVEFEKGEYERGHGNTVH